MPPLPTGTVTLLFSDMEGSTRLLHRLGDAYGDVLALQRRLLREAWQAHGGVELGTEGDSFYVAFGTARDGLLAAVDGQRRLGAAEWPDEAEVRVRMGLHTGTPVVHGDSYVGMDVHRAARVAATAYGGQALVTEATAALGRSAGFDFVDLGHHRLKDIPAPEHLFQVVAVGIAQSFPPVRSLGSTTRLPSPANALIGREAEISAVTELVDGPGVRLVTLTGPGGTGKTRLAIAVASEVGPSHPDGVYFVAAETVTDETGLWSALGAALDLPPEARHHDGIVTALRDVGAVFVLDNLEQVSGAAGVVDELVQNPRVTVLATSRQPVGVEGEHEYPVPPLPLPPTGDQLDAAASSPSVALLVRAARMVNPRFGLDERNLADVIAIARRLDGLPLALELAAARLKLLSPRALLARLEKGMELQAQGASRPDRQRTLRATIRWSHDLLDDDERALFRAMGVFVGGADLDALSAIGAAVGVDAALDVVEGLVAASLVMVSEGLDLEPRFAMLNTILDFARAELAGSDQAERVGAVAASYFAEHVRELDWSAGAERRAENLRWLDAEHDNVARALEWFLGHAPSSPEAARTSLGLAANLAYRYLTPRGLFEEAGNWCRRALAIPGHTGPSRGACLLALSQPHFMAGDIEGARGVVAEAGDVLAEAEPDEWFDEQGIRLLRLVVLYNTGAADQEIGEVARARAAYDRCLELEQGDDDIRGGVLINLGQIELSEGNVEMALDLERQAIIVARRLGDVYMMLVGLLAEAGSLRELGRPAEAAQIIEEQFPVAVAERAVDVVAGFAEERTQMLLAELEYPAAAVLVGAVDALRERLSMPRGIMQRDFEEDLAAASAAFEPWAAHVSQGHALSVEEAMAAATRLVRQD